MRGVSEILADMAEPDASEPVSESAREAIRDGLCRTQEPPDEHEQPGLPLGWHGIEIVS